MSVIALSSSWSSSVRSQADMFHIRLNILPDDEVLVTLHPEVYAGSGEKEGGGSDAPEVLYTIAEAFSEIDGAGWSGERGEGVNREVGENRGGYGGEFTA